jgi:hypothetical protein
MNTFGPDREVAGPSEDARPRDLDAYVRRQPLSRQRLTELQRRRADGSRWRPRWSFRVGARYAKRPPQNMAVLITGFS